MGACAKAVGTVFRSLIAGMVLGGLVFSTKIKQEKDALFSNVSIYIEERYSENKEKVVVLKHKKKATPRVFTLRVNEDVLNLTLSSVEKEIYWPLFPPQVSDVDSFVIASVSRNTPYQTDVTPASIKAKYPNWKQNQDSVDADMLIPINEKNYPYTCARNFVVIGSTGLMLGFEISPDIYPVIPGLTYHIAAILKSKEKVFRVEMGENELQHIE
ncbi:MAG: hypothetical protein ACPL06_04205 [Candidatus Anstonellales archaeon]